MKKDIIVILLLCLGYVNVVKAENTDLTALENVVYASAGNAVAGQTSTLSIRMKNKAAIRGFQFHLYLPEGVTAVRNGSGQIQATLCTDRLAAGDGHNLLVSEQTDGSLVFLCGSLSVEDFVGEDGEIASLSIKVSKDVVTGDYPIILKDIKLTETDIRNFYATERVSSTLAIEGAEDNYASLGVGTLTDAFMEGTTSVEIMQSQTDAERFRIMRPYSGITSSGSSDYEGSEYMEIVVLDPEWSLGGIDITKNDLVYFKPTNTGYHHETYDADVWLYHPVYFEDMNSEDYWLHSKVLSYQENGLPAKIQLAPSYYMDGIGGWNETQEDGVILITFPGCEDPKPDGLYSDVSQMENAIYIEPLVASAGSELSTTVRLKNAGAVGGYSFDLVLPEGVSVGANSKGKPNVTLIETRHDQHSISVNYADGYYSVAVLSLAGGELSGHDGAVVSLPLVVSGDLSAGTYPITIRNVAFSTPQAVSVTVPDVVVPFTVTSMQLGDVNGDGTVNIADAIGIVNKVVRKESATFYEEAADVNGDGRVNIADAIAIVNIVVRKDNKENDPQ